MGLTAASINDKLTQDVQRYSAHRCLNTIIWQMARKAALVSL
jgi:hypothetical protein